MIRILFLLLFVLPAMAQEPESVRTALNSPKDLACQAPYQRIFAKGSATIRVVFGYKDTRPSRFVGDRHERLAFVQRILARCKGLDQACGFTRVEDQADVFTKTIPGPSDKPVQIELVVTNSSVGSDDASNRENPMQKWQSKYAELAFFSGLAKADVVFYNGHSRFGGGPDFNPPKIRKSGEVNSAYYHTKHSGFQKVRAQLRKKKSKEGLKVLGLFSCSSSQHFANAVAHDSKAGLISSRALIYYADAMENSITALSALLEMRCEQSFKNAIRHGSRQQGSQLKGMF